MITWSPNPCRGGAILTPSGRKVVRVIAADRILADFGIRLWRALWILLLLKGAKSSSCNTFLIRDQIITKSPRGQIVILQHFSHQPITIRDQIITIKEDYQILPLKPTPLDARVQKAHFPQLSKTIFLCPKTTWIPPSSIRGSPRTT